jgi:hypothetical protein
MHWSYGSLPYSIGEVEEVRNIRGMRKKERRKGGRRHDNSPIPDGF